MCQTLPGTKGCLPEKRVALGEAWVPQNQVGASFLQRDLSHVPLRGACIRGCWWWALGWPQRSVHSAAATSKWLFCFIDRNCSKMFFTFNNYKDSDLH